MISKPPGPGGPVGRPADTWSRSRYLTRTEAGEYNHCADMATVGGQWGPPGQGHGAQSVSALEEPAACHGARRALSSQATQLGVAFSSSKRRARRSEDVTGAASHSATLGVALARRTPGQKDAAATAAAGSAGGR